MSRFNGGGHRTLTIYRFEEAIDWAGYLGGADLEVRITNRISVAVEHARQEVDVLNLDGASLML